LAWRKERQYRTTCGQRSKEIPLAQDFLHPHISQFFNFFLSTKAFSNIPFFSGEANVHDRNTDDTKGFSISSDDNVHLYQHTGLIGISV